MVEGVVEVEVEGEVVPKGNLGFSCFRAFELMGIQNLKRSLLSSSSLLLPFSSSPRFHIYCITIIPTWRSEFLPSSRLIGCCQVVFLRLGLNEISLIYVYNYLLFLSFQCMN